jgi:NADPH:quinone reductase
VNVIAPFITLFTANGFGWPIPGTDAAKGFDYSAQTLLIIGGGANTGKFMTQFAKWAGVGTIIAVAGPKNEAELKKYGATHIIDRHSSSALEEIRAITGDELTCVFDCVNEGDLTFGVSALSNTKNGLVACLIPGKADEAKVVGEKKGGYDCRHQLGLSWAHPEAAKFFWGHMEGWLKDGVITPGSFEVYEGLDADKINAVYDNYRDGKAQGKVHIRP